MSDSVSRMRAQCVKDRLAHEGFKGCFSVRKYRSTWQPTVRVLFRKSDYPMPELLEERQEANRRASEIVREEYGYGVGASIHFVTPNIRDTPED